ncbi:MAG: MarR family winged helix-turn-helix transcriptional regulator [Leptospirales bacterium]|nr:MarR family winged helix-turn-helix transcriptional regulator [Leptospirales bacterium]
MAASSSLLLSIGAAYRGSLEIIRKSAVLKDKHSTLAVSILQYVDRNSGVAQGELGRILRRDPMTMSQAIRAMQEAGWLVSKADAEDRRVKRLAVTAKGKKVSKAIRSSEEKLARHLAKAWGKSRYERFLKDLNDYDGVLNAISGNG